MNVIHKINWDNIDDDKIVGDFIDMPDGSKQYVEMSLLHWYWLDFMVNNTNTPVSQIVNDTIEILEGHPEADFDVIFRTCIMSFGREWIRQTEGR